MDSGCGCFPLHQSEMRKTYFLREGGSRAGSGKRNIVGHECWWPKPIYKTLRRTGTCIPCTYHDEDTPKFSKLYAVKLPRCITSLLIPSSTALVTCGYMVVYTKHYDRPWPICVMHVGLHMSPICFHFLFFLGRLL